jgi:hypothetical protein
MSNSNDEGVTPSRRAFTATLGTALGSALLASCSGQNPDSNHASANSTSTNTAVNASATGKVGKRAIAFRPIIIRNGSLTVGLLDKFSDFWTVSAGSAVATLKNTNLKIHSISVAPTSTGECQVLDVATGDACKAEIWYDSAVADQADIIVESKADGKMTVTFKPGLLSKFVPKDSEAPPKTKFAIKVDEVGKFAKEIRFTIGVTVDSTHTLAKESVIDFILVE